MTAASWICKAECSQKDTSLSFVSLEVGVEKEGPLPCLHHAFFKQPDPPPPCHPVGTSPTHNVWSQGAVVRSEGEWKGLKERWPFHLVYIRQEWEAASKLSKGRARDHSVSSPHAHAHAHAQSGQSLCYRWELTNAQCCPQSWPEIYTMYLILISPILIA